MITLSDFYHVMTAVVPLYTTMIAAYGSVKWWKVFSPDQCSGINRFVPVFAIPLLSFHLIASNNPYEMNFTFIAADTLQKIIILVLLFVFSLISKNGSLEWTITLFSVTTLPNTLVVGIPLLSAMYGKFCGSLMVQIVVFQSIIWYNLLLFLFEYRAARLLITEQFPETAGSIASIHVDSDVVSLDGKQPLETETEIIDGKLHVTVKRLNASISDIFPRKSAGLVSLSPRLSNLTNAEIYSLQSSRNPTPRGSSFNPTDFGASDVYGFSSSRPSNYEEDGKARFHHVGTGMFSNAKRHNNGNERDKDLHMFVWSPNASSPLSDVYGGGSHEYGPHYQKELRLNVSPGKVEGHGDNQGEFVAKGEISFGNRGIGEKGEEDGEGSPRKMPSAFVMTRLMLTIVWRKLIRNPNTYATLLGLAWSLVSFRWNVEMPAIVAKSISILSDAGLGMAMFSLGLFMALQPKIIACGNAKAAFALAVRFLAGPALMAAASILLGIRGLLLRVAILQAALPQGIVPFVFAREYNVHPDVLSTAVIFGMLVALPILLVYYILLAL